MTTKQLLTELRDRDIRLWREDDQLKFSAPTGALTPELRAQIGSHREELLELLRGADASGESVQLLPVTRDQDLPLSFGQQRLWFIDQLEPESLAYNVPANARLKGPLDVDVLQRSLDAIVARHETLRSRFPTIDGKPSLVIDGRPEMSLELEDLGALPAEQRFDEGKRLALAQGALPFDLGEGPLVRGKLFRLDDEDHIIHVCMHHIISDGWSMGVFFRELAALYEALVDDRPSPLPELEVQYADYAHWQQEMLSGPYLERDLKYWRERLGDDLPTLDLPTDRPRPTSQSHVGSTETTVLPDALFASLKELCKRQGVTMFMLMLAAFKVLLSRYSGQTDLVVGTPIAGRNRQEVEGLIGFFVNNLVLRTDLADDPTFPELLDRIRQIVLGAFARPEVPFEKLVEELKPDREIGRNPLFQILFNHFAMDTTYAATRLGTVEMQPVRSHLEIAKFDMTMHCYEDHGRLVVRIEYACDLFDPETIRRMSKHYLHLLQQIGARADRPISRLRLMDESERTQVLVEWNQTERDLPRERCAPQLFQDRARACPDAPAVVFEDRALTYAALDTRTRRLARRLRELGVGPDDRVALFFDRSLEMIEGLMGVLAAGAAYVPLDPAYPGDRVQFMLEDSAAKVVLTSTSRAAGLPPGAWQVLCLDGEQDLDIADEGNDPLPDAEPGDLAYVMYTSGTTGRSKGVQIEHRQLLNYTQGVLEVLELPEGSSFATVSTLAADLGNTSIYGALCSGGCLHVLSEDRIGNGDAFAEYMHGKAIDCVKIVPSHLEALLAAASHPEHVLPRRLLVVGGEASSWTLVERVQSLSPACAIVNHYGPTESTVGVLTHRILPGDRKRYPVAPPIGKPMANTRVYLLDSRGQPVPIGAAGVLHVGGLSVARGYLNRPEENRKRFLEDRFGGHAGGRLYNTGDLARSTPDGEIHFLGRSDDQVKIRGFRIELGEIQSHLDQHPTVTAAAVLAQKDDDGHKRLIGYVASPTNPTLSPSELREFLRDRLPDYMVPSAFVILSELPRTPNGKLDRRALPTPDLAHAESQGEFVSPRTEVEETLARIWSDVLRVERVGVNDSFFEMGGDSILSIQIIAKANRAGIRLTPRDLFESPTVARLATIAGTAPAIDAEQGVVSGEVPLTPIQKRFFELEPVQPNHYNHAMLVRLGRPVDPETLREAVKHLLEHHDALRLRVQRSGGQWSQEIAPEVGEVPFTCEDLSGLPNAEWPKALEARAEQLQASLDLSAGPLMRVAQFRLQPEENDRVLIVIHHMAVDGVSWSILLEDLQTAIEQLERGETARLPAKTTSFLAWAERLREHAASQEQLEAYAFWDQAGLHEGSRLPVDHAEGSEGLAVGSVAVLTVELDQDDTRALLMDVPKAYRTRIDDALLSALGKAVRPWMGGAPVVVDVEGHGREDLFDDMDLSRTVGWFTSVYPVLIDVGEHDEHWPANALKAVKEKLRAVPDGGISWGLARYLGVEDERVSRLSDIPQAEIGFNYMGRFDQILDGDALFIRATERSGSPVSPRNRRRYPLEFTAAVRNGRLRIHWVYNRDVHEESTIRTLSERYLTAVRELIRHCAGDEARGYTPSDFPLARVDQEMIDRLEARFGHRQIQDIYRLTPTQQGLMFHTLEDPTSGVYIEQIRCTFDGLDVDAFRRTWERIFQRHDVFRTSIEGIGEEDVAQVVQRQVDLPMELHDCRQLGSEEQDGWIRAFLRRDSQRGFDLNTPPLVRLSLIRLGERRYEFVWSFHHLLLDGWSFGVCLREMLQTYKTFIRGEEPEFHPDTAYRDYLGWLGAVSTEKAEGHWRQLLADFTTPTPIRVGREASARRQDVRTYDEVTEFLSPELTGRVVELARSLGVTLNTVVLGAWALLLGRYSGQDDIVFGTTVSGRPSGIEGIEDAVGLFVNTLPMRVVMPGEADELRQWLGDLQTQQVVLRDYDFTPLLEAQRASGVPFGERMFETIIGFQNYPFDIRAESRGEEGLKTSYTPTTARTGYPLALIVIPGRRLYLQVLFDSERFDNSQVRSILRHVQMLLEGMTRQERGLMRLPLLTEDERDQVLVEWNRTERDYPTEPCTYQLVEEHATVRPDALAVASSTEELSYGELNRRANQVGRRLRDLGVGPDDRVALYARPGPPMVVAKLGIWKAGGAYVPLDQAYPAQRLAYMLQDCGAKVVLTESAMGATLPEHDLPVVHLDELEHATARDEKLSPSAGPVDLAYVIYTSGSTGRPKGVEVTHGALLNLVCWHRETYDLDPADRTTQVAAMGFDACAWELWPTLAAGASLHLAPEEIRGVPDEMWRWLADREITVTFVPTPLAELMFKERLPEDLKLRALLTGGDRLRFGLERPLPFRVVNHYGPTESAVVSTFGEVGIESPPPIGRPIANLRLYVLDGSQQPVPVGVPGELYVAGRSLARGYLGQPKMTAERFVHDPFSDQPAELMYRTGDLVRYRPDGAVDFLGRVDHQVQIRGHRVELSEIESVLHEHRMVAEAIVIVDEQDDGRADLVAYIRPELDELSDEEEDGHVEQWRELYDETYGVDEDKDPTFNIVGWNSSYTGEPIPSEEMREWVDQSVERILAKHPRNVLEIGCGTGLLLFPVAPHCERYVGVDFSKVALDHIARFRDAHIPESTDLNLVVGAAHELDVLPSSRFDGVVLNSVAQYFPDVDYLHRVLEGAIERVAAGGFVYVGDMRNLRLLDAYHASVQLAMAPDDLTAETLRQRIHRNIVQENELVVDPSFFLALAARNPRISHVEIMPRRGRATNELTKFRYDVMLEIEGEAKPSAPVEWFRWDDLEAGVETIREWMETRRFPVFGVRGIANARVLADTSILELLDRDDDPSMTAGALKNLVQRYADSKGADPEQLWTMEDTADWEVRLSWSEPSSHGGFGALFRHKDAADVAVPIPNHRERDWAHYANSPVRARIEKEVAPQLRADLERILPAYMVPSVIVPLDKMPLTAHGKIDRRALPRPTRSGRAGGTPPQTEMQVLLAEVWSEILGVDQINLEDNFFDLGGHSLLTLQVVKKMEDQTGVRVPLGDFMIQSLGQIAAFFQRETEKEEDALPESKSALRSGVRAFLRKMRIRTRP